MLLSSPLTHIGPYQFLRFIGSGNAALVYLATDGQREVAVKIRERRPRKHEDFLSTRFRESGKLQRMFCHPNVIWLYDSIETERHQALILEYASGGTLGDLCKVHTSFSRLDVCTLGVYIADALDHLHDVGVTHRDIKPDNLIFGQQGVMSSIKVADFDVSKHYKFSPNITEPGSHVGTLWYTSPEQFDQASPKPFADVYSLGIVLYEAMAGRLPFEPFTTSTVFQRFLDHIPLPSLSYFCPEAGPGLDWVIERAIDTQLPSRIPSAATFACLLMALEPSLLSSYHRAPFMLRQTIRSWIHDYLPSAPLKAQSELIPALKRMEVLD